LSQHDIAVKRLLTSFARSSSILNVGARLARS